MDFGTGSSPVLCGDQVLVASDNEKDSYLKAFHKESGKSLWTASRSSDAGAQPLPLKSSWVTPFVWNHSVRTEIVWAGPDRASSFDVDGNELWSMRGMGIGVGRSFLRGRRSIDPKRWARQSHALHPSRRPWRHFVAVQREQQRVCGLDAGSNRDVHPFGSGLRWRSLHRYRQWHSNSTGSCDGRNIVPQTTIGLRSRLYCIPLGLRWARVLGERARRCVCRESGAGVRVVPCQ